eukprot:m.5851 g.5851  ORF g.5851 m.5851 type:complete len:302 (+) comp5669_c0_seq2:1-906(+)
MSSAATAAFIGLGAMGFPMASHLARHSSRLLVFNRTHQKAKEHQEAFGSIAVKTLSEICEAKVIFACLSTSQIVQQVTDSIFEHFQPGSILVDCTSGDPMLSRDIASRLQSKQVHYVDCPVSGGVAGAEKGTLTAMLGGSSLAIDQVRPLIETFAKNLIHIGDTPGSGHACKAINNTLNTCHLIAAAEGLAALKRFGVDPVKALQAINQSSGRSMATTHKIPDHVVTRKFGHGFALELMNKDNQIGMSILKAQYPEAKLLPLATQITNEAEKLVGPKADYTEIVKVVEKESGQDICPFEKE